MLARTITLWVLPAAIGWACSCAPGAWAPLCQTFHGASTVFLGTVLDHNDDGSGKYLQWTNYLVRVDEAFKGLGPDQKEVFIDPGSFTSCYGGFESGKQYLFVTGKPAYAAASVVADATGGKGYPARWESKRGLHVFFVMGCNPTGLAEHKADDIAWLRSWQKGETQTRVFGLAIQNYDSPFSPPNMKEVVPAAEARILLQNETNRYEAASGSSGRFAFERVEPGSYTLSSAPGTRWVPPKPVNIKVERGGCAAQNLNFESHGTVSGALLNHEGNPAPGISVQLVQVLPGGELSSERTMSVKTDAKGRFEMKKVSFGEFVLGVNIATPPTAELPFRATYFPGVRDGSAAQRISPDSKDLMFRLPLPLRTRKVTVRLFWADGTPVTYGGRVSVDVQNKRAEFERIKVGNTVDLEIVEGLDVVFRGQAFDLSWNPSFVDGEKVAVPGGTGPVTVDIRLKRNQPPEK